MTFTAKYRSECADCGDAITPGDEATSMPHGTVHAKCPDAVDGIAPDRLCMECFMEKSLAGTCGCVR